MVSVVMKFKDAYYDKPRQCFKKLRHHLACKGLYSQLWFFQS